MSNKKQVAKFSILFVIIYIFAALILTSFVPYLTGIGYNALERGILLSTYGVVGIFLQIIFGFLSDKYHTIKRFTILALIMLSASGFLMFILGTKLFIYHLITIAIAGSFTGLNISLNDNWVLEFSDNTREKYSFIRMFGSLGFGIGSLITSSVVLKFGYSGLAYSIVILWLLAICIMMSIPDAQKSSDSAISKLKLSDVKILFKNDKYRLLILIMICLFCLNTANLIVAVDKMMDLGATAKEVGYKFSITGLIELPLYFSGVYFTRRLKEYRLLIIAAVTLTVQFFLFAVATTPMQIVFISGLQFIHGPFINMAAKGLIYKYSDDKLKSTGQLVAVSIYGGISGLMVPVIAGAVTDRFNVNTTLYGTALIGIIGVVLSCILYKKGNTQRSKKLEYVLEK